MAHWTWAEWGDALWEVESTVSTSIDADATITALGAPTWVSPADDTYTSSTPTLVFQSPSSSDDLHFHLEIDTADTFDTSNLRTYKTNASTTNWEYWDGDSWEPFPSTGLPSAYTGNNVRLSITSALDPNTWYRRVRAGVA